MMKNLRDYLETHMNAMGYSHDEIEDLFAKKGNVGSILAEVPIKASGTKLGKIVIDESVDISQYHPNQYDSMTAYRSDRNDAVRAVDSMSRDEYHRSLLLAVAENNETPASAARKMYHYDSIAAMRNPV